METGSTAGATGVTHRGQRHVVAPAARDAGEPQEATQRLRAWRRERLGGLSIPGLVIASIALIAANTPSLLPRPWWLHGILAAVCALLGYVIGVLGGWVIRGVGGWLGLEMSVDLRRVRRLELLLAAVLLVAVVTFPVLTIRWQQNVSRAVGMEPPGRWDAVGSVLVALATFVVLISVWRLVEGTAQWLMRRLRSRRVRRTTAQAVAVVATVGLVVATYAWVIAPVMRWAVVRSAAETDATPPVGLSAPTEPTRSGGPGSPHSWESLGQDGAKFVSLGPRADDIEAVTGQPAQEPLRLFVGQHDTLEQSRDAVLAEMDRTDAWSREAILVAIPTSTGYISDSSTSAFEYLLHGDSAVVSFAYSDLPSVFGFLMERDDSPRVARILLEGVRERVDALPADRRPKVYLTGESLGAYGGDASFGSPQEMLAASDGAVWSGTPSFSPNRALLTENRQPGSTSILPVVDNGRNIRFAGTPEHLHADEYGRPLPEWDLPRVVYLQHASDPIAWWTPSLLWRSPSWLREPRPGTVMEQMSWMPLVTFWQVTADMAVSINVPPGTGHRYFGNDMVPAWSEVLDLEDPGDQQRERLIDAVDGQVSRAETAESGT